jgi:uncharacterized protein (TIGR00255 family)
MTGYGSAECSEDGISYSLEIRSLNNRYLKASIKLPEGFAFAEADVDKQIRRRLGRGSVNYTLRMRNQSPTAAYDINRAAMERYLRDLCTANLPGGVATSVDLAAVAALPGVTQPPAVDEQAKQRQSKVVADLTERAIDSLLLMRQAEGQVLRDELLAHCESIRKHLGDIRKLAPEAVKEYHKKLQERVQSLLAEAKLELEKDSLMREVAIYADRCDISEEVTRLGCHLDQFDKVCNGNDHAGRRLDFLTQEMLREANTIGSKSNNAQIAGHIIEIKAWIDRVKEQVQNVE